MNHPLGKPINMIQKILIGGFGLLGIVALVAGPLAIFSSLNPVAVDNKVTGATLRFNIEIGSYDEGSVVNQYTIYENQYVTQLQNINDYLYKGLKLNSNSKTRNYDRDLFQVVEMNENSDSVWAMSPPNQVALHQILSDAVDNINSTDVEINLNLYYSFTRPNPEGANELDQAINMNIFDAPLKDREIILKNLRDAVDPDTPCAASEASFTVENYYVPVIKLTNSLKPDYLDIDELRASVKFYKH